MNRAVKITGLLVLIGLLILIRAFENELFYDPYLNFFKNDYLYLDHPPRDVLKLTWFTSLRYILNSSISIGIIFLIFYDRDIVQFSVLVYAVSFVILLLVFLYFVINPKQADYYILFNIRRFLIQPLLLLLLLPAFYYNKLKSKKQ